MVKKLKLITVFIICSVLLSSCFFERKSRDTQMAKNENQEEVNTNVPLENRGASRDNTIHDTGKYTYNEPVEIESTHIFSYKTGSDFGSKFDVMNTRNYFGVYTNAALTMFVEPRIDYNAGKREVTISPPDVNAVVVPTEDMYLLEDSDKEFAEFFIPDNWGQIYNDFYLVQKVDLKTGEDLAKPIVTPFHVRENPAAVETRYELTNQGILHLSWDPVEGAERYFIISVRSTYHPEEKYNTTGNFVRIIDQTLSTEWFSSDPEGQSFALNDLMAQYDISDDALQQNKDDEFYIKASETSYYCEYGIIADFGGKYSSYNPVSGTELAEYIPIQIAYNASNEMGFGAEGVTIDQLPAQCPVTVATGETKLYTVTYDMETLLLYENGGGMGFRVNETALQGIISFTGVQGTDEDYAALEQKIASLYSEMKTPAGGTKTYTYAKDPPKLEEKTHETEIETQYPVNGSTEFVRFLAENMIQRNEWIDYSSFSSAEMPRDIWDAVNEATYQNPMILWKSYYYNHAQDKVLYVAYEDAETWEQKQNEIMTRAQNIVSQIISDDMTDRDKAKVINDYLVDNCEYDYVALENRDLYGRDNMDPSHYDAWTAYGMLIKETGVCASYSYTFKLLADLSDLNAIVVSGDVESGLHAWNKVLIDGTWLNIDSTWNDSLSAPNQYFLISDNDPGFATHKENASFMLDQYLHVYSS